MEVTFICMLVAATSISTFVATKRRRHTLGGVAMRQAVRSLFEWAGTFALFFAANLGLGVAVIFLIRGFTPRFVALYALENLLLLILSAAQAFVFHQWWKHD